MIKRPQLDYEKTAEVDRERAPLPDAVCEQAEIKLKYDGYIKRQIMQVEQFRKMEEKLLPQNQDAPAHLAHHQEQGDGVASGGETKQGRSWKLFVRNL